MCMTPAQVAGALYSMISGTEAMKITSNGEEYSVYLEFPEGTYDNASRLLGASVGGVPLSEMASLEYTDSQQTIMKTDGKYTLTINATCLSENLSAIQEELEERAENMNFANTVEIAQNSMDEMMIESFTSLGLAIAADWLLWTFVYHRPGHQHDISYGNFDACRYRGKQWYSLCGWCQ